MPGQAPSHRVNGKAHVLTLRAKTARQLGDRLLRLCDRHAVARHDDDGLGFGQSVSHASGLNGDLLALDLHLAAATATKAAQDHRDERAVHGLTHDVGQNGTRSAHERAGYDQ